MEVADVFVINKADRPGARETERDLRTMLDMSDLGDWTPPIVRATATTGEGVPEVWKAIGDHHSFLDDSGLLEERRSRRLEEELREIVVRRLEQQAYERCGGERFEQLVADLSARRLDPYSAAERLISGPD